MQGQIGGQAARFAKAKLTALALSLALGATGCGLLDKGDPAFDIDRSVGDSAHDLLSDERFRSLVVELQAVPGSEPTPEAKAALREFLAEHLNKPDGIRLVDDPPIQVTPQATYSIGDAHNLELRGRSVLPGSATLSVYLLFVDGVSPDNRGIYQTLGVSYRNTSMIVYEGTLHAMASRPGQPSLQVLETTVMLHEFGHLLGLVGAGTPMQSQHEDPEHRGHCSNPQCLMYFSTHSNPQDAIIGGSVPTLDANCLQDLQANGGK